jgi:hypothetical protein
MVLFSSGPVLSGYPLEFEGPSTGLVPDKTGLSRAAGTEVNEMLRRLAMPGAEWKREYMYRSKEEKAAPPPPDQDFRPATTQRNGEIAIPVKYICWLVVLLLLIVVGEGYLIYKLLQRLG